MRLSILTATLALAACAGDPLPPTEQVSAVPVPPQPLAECQAPPVQRFAGQRFQPSLPEAARLASGARTVRLIRPGTMVTRDYRIDRLNIDIDARETVTALRCG